MSENKRTVTGRMLPMDDTELSISFRGAKDKRHQIEVLADLNVCAPFAIAQRLEGMGCFDGSDLRAEQFSRQFAPVNASRKYPTHRRPPSREPIDELRAMELFRDGLDDVAIAEALDCAKSRVKEWRSRMHLLRPLGGNHRLKEDREPMAKKECAPEPDEVAKTAPETRKAAFLTVGEFLTTLTELLTPAATKARLVINGAPVSDVALIICNIDQQLAVELETNSTKI